MSETKEIVIKVAADMSQVLTAFDVLIEELTATRARLQSRLENLVEPRVVPSGKPGQENAK